MFDWVFGRLAMGVFEASRSSVVRRWLFLVPGCFGGRYSVDDLDDGGWRGCQLEKHAWRLFGAAEMRLRSTEIH
jgi:hypothetical protein